MKKVVSLLIKPASALCNLRCRYCFYADISAMREVRSYGRMKPATAAKIIPNVFADLNDGDELSIAFQGGEPTLAGLPFYQQFVALVAQQTKRVQVHYAIQTNGIVINARWCQFLVAHHFLVGLSLDGLPQMHDRNRVDPRGQGTYRRVLQTKRLFDQYGVDYNILCVLTNELARHPEKVYHFLQAEHVDYVQFIPCLDELETTSPSQYALAPRRFASFYQQLFELWWQDFQAGHYMSIKLFDDIYNLFERGMITACGILGKCQTQFVIEADGSVYPCDFYALDQYRLGYLTQETLRELFSKPLSLDWQSQRRQLPSYCTACPFKKMCCGGCKRMKDAIYVTPEEDFCGYQAVLAIVVPRLKQVKATAVTVAP